MSTVSGSSAAPTRRRIGKYVLTGRIGKGGMGRVYRGYDEALEREVAVKTLSYEGSQDDDHRRRFFIEAKAAARLQHANIVTVYELGEDRGVPFIAMELLPGVDLEALLRSGEPMPLQEALDVMAQVCRGLQFAHDRGIVHRDIKPSNIRVLDDGSAKIMDFGIAKLGASGITKTGMMVGTVHYMSPEQVRGQALDGRSDVFSLGVILYELLARRRPFAGETATEILYKIVHEEPTALATAELGAGGSDLHDVVLRALAKDPAQRWASAAALGDALGRLLSGPLKPEAGAALALGDTVKRMRASGGTPPVEDDFPELDATFHSPATADAGAAPAPPPAETRLPDLPPTILAMRTALTRLLPLPAAVSGRPLLAVGAVALVLAVSAGAYFATRGATPPAQPQAARAPLRTVTSPAAPADTAVPAVTEPPAARAKPAGPQGKVMVSSPYAIDVTWKDRVLARGQTSAELSLPVGRQALVLAAPRYLLRATVTVDVTPDAVAEVSAPELGRINIRANPDNCKVFIDGAFIDYPPILDHPLATGTHNVSFKWPDAESREEVVVELGRPAYVTGRKQ